MESHPARDIEAVHFGTDFCFVCIGGKATDNIKLSIRESSENLEPVGKALDRLYVADECQSQGLRIVDRRGGGGDGDAIADSTPGRFGLKIALKG